MKLISEKPICESYAISEGVEDGSAEKFMYLSGPMLGSELLNKNKRIYDDHWMTEAVDEYRNDKIKNRRSVGELNHPERATVDYNHATHLLTELRKEGNVFYGKAKIIHTPKGHLIESLVRAGVNVGMSSRALGDLEERRDGTTRVGRMVLCAIDCVSDPSYPTAYMNGIMESTEYVLNESNGLYEPAYDNFQKAISTIPTKSTLKDEYLLENIKKFFSEIGSPSK